MLLLPEQDTALLVVCHNSSVNRDSLPKVEVGSTSTEVLRKKERKKKSTNPCEYTPVASAASSFLASPPKRNVSEEVRTSQLIARHERLIWKKPRR